MFFGTDQILVRRRYGYKLRGCGLENYTDNGAAVKKIYCIPKNPSLAGNAGTQILKQRGVGLEW